MRHLQRQAVNQCLGRVANTKSFAQFARPPHWAKEMADEMAEQMADEMADPSVDP